MTSRADRRSRFPMVRNVQQINIALRRGGSEDPRPFSDFTASQNVVLLGDPGSGKSHLFRETAAAEGARFVTARAFLVTPTQRLKGQALYIDGLDERRAGSGDRDTIDTIVQKLFEVEPTKLRISCRVGSFAKVAPAPSGDTRTRSSTSWT